MRSRQADEYRNLEEDYRQRHQKLREDHEQEVQNCIRHYFAKNNQDQPEDLSLHRQHGDYSTNSSGANSFSSHANSTSGFSLQMAAAAASGGANQAGMFRYFDFSKKLFTYLNRPWGLVQTLWVQYTPITYQKVSLRRSIGQ